MTWMLWVDAVLTGAKCSVEQSKPYRARLQRAYQMGETVDMSVYMLTHCLKYAALHERAEADHSLIRNRGKL
jgi:hypothetical protein